MISSGSTTVPRLNSYCGAAERRSQSIVDSRVVCKRIDFALTLFILGFLFRCEWSQNLGNWHGRLGESISDGAHHIVSCACDAGHCLDQEEDCRYLWSGIDRYAL